MPVSRRAAAGRPGCVGDGGPSVPLQFWQPEARGVAAHAPRLLTSGAMEDSEIYQTIGEEGFERLVAAFYRQVVVDDILGPMYPPDDLEGSEQRLRDFLVGRFGGPARYIEQRGHPRLRMRHAPFVIDGDARNRWVDLMSRALDEVKLPREVELALRPFFEGVATMMINSRSAAPGWPATPRDSA